MPGHVVIAWLAVLLAASAGPQRPTIPEILAADGASRRVSTIPSGLAPALDVVLQRADMVVRARVGEGTSLLSDDERDVYTAYRLTDVSLLYKKPLRRPTMLPDLLIAIPGGEITIDGRTFVHEDEAFPLLVPGTVGVFLLEQKGDRYRLAGPGLGAFAITREGLRPLSRMNGFGRELAGLSAADAQALIAARAQAVHR